MSLTNKIIFHEGMVLEPQTFQENTKYLKGLIDFKIDILQHELWGFTELSLDTDLLAIGKLGIASARGIFQDGTVFSIPTIDEVPIPYTVQEGLCNTVLYLALPINHAGVADAGDENAEQAYRYRAVNRKVRNNIADSDDEIDLSVGSLHCRFLSDDDDREGYLCLPMLKIKEVRSQNNVKFDKTFIPVWLDVFQSAPLTKFLEEVMVLLSNRAEMLSNRLTDTGQAGSADIVDLSLLQLSNKYETIFRNLMNKKLVFPKELYHTLTEMLAEMSTFTTDKRRPVHCEAYKHSELYTTFQPLIKAARKSLSMVLEQNATAIDLVVQGHGLWVGELSDKDLLSNSDFVLAVYADVPLENLRNSFPSQIKISPVEKIKTLVSRSLPGIALQAIAIAPRQIPYHPNFCYFSINAKGDLWESLKTSEAIALHITGDLPGVKLTLWAIKG